MIKNNTKIEIIMGSDSDLEVMALAAKVLEDFNIKYKINIVSAHRTPDKLYQHAKNARRKSIKVIIAGAGGSAHLPGMTASMTVLPVIGIPIKTKTMEGIDSLLSIVQMPPGVPVATVGINAGKNAGLLAVQILALSDKNLENKLIAYKQKLGEEIKTKGEKLSKMGYKKYLENK